jgi:hypothetical protein|nr:hypothetical protein [uncultured Mediterranean phage uvMED]BAR16163.1 hypothetical protein [uncultured Mediterranean phage uvMED]|tara:strand:+ start:1807 stop:1956 length:150 start_codon:yes stop_codon:yes gene_type:complete
MARVKFDVNKLPHERIPKRTSITTRKKPKFSSMNKHKKRTWKKRNRGGR